MCATARVGTVKSVAIIRGNTARIYGTGICYANTVVTSEYYHTPHHHQEYMSMLYLCLLNDNFQCEHSRVDCRSGVGGGRLGVPLAEQMRPTTIDGYVGQESVIGRNAILRRILESGNVPSLIFWGPPGCGKVLQSVCVH